MKNLYRDYFQKSKTFLFPILGFIRKKYIQPVETFIAWTDKEIKPEDCHLIALYDKVDSKEFKEFEESMLKKHPLFLKAFHNEESNTAAYVFNLAMHEKDWLVFLDGHYSKLSPKLKGMVIDYYGKESPEAKYAMTFLYPEEFFQLYAELLEIDVETLQKVGELCDRYDEQKEDVTFFVTTLQNLGENSVDLQEQNKT